MRQRNASPRRRLLVWATALVLLLGVGAGTAVTWQNTYALREERVTVRHEGRDLDGVLALPESGEGPFGLVVFVHGDGPVDATHDTFYRPLWEAFARAGYASLSLSKPGVGDSEGDWLDQSMDDRAEETLAAVSWGRARPDIDGHRVGLWGASQAGWVLPKVAARDGALRFVIAVSPAVDWLRQGRYNLMAELRESEATPGETREALRRRETTLRLLREGADFERYRDAVGGPQAMTAERWRFVGRNFRSNASADLRSMGGTPTLLVLAGHDLNVDVTDTETTYRRLLPPDSLTVRYYPDATHSLVRNDLEGDPVPLTLTALLAPRQLFAPGFLDDQQRFLERVSDGEGAA
ncbi:alpha/beta hydrolase family protein [Nocardiopsis lucentensis]|uniref:alpha/beta hydrolase family protein n=1 Tax=Nocardiopsis lucentensis TaxID=53441 RepID=UPI0004777F43|nr:CocE/NonD family hydrolase [Nocardiopsis lucentensis]